MKDELDPEEKAIIDEYPKIFTKVKRLYVGKGWWPLINLFCRMAQRRIDDPPYKLYGWEYVKYLLGRYLRIPCDFRYRPTKSAIPQVEALQIKEKFGALRFYFSGGDPYIQALMDFASSLSNHVCEDCGAPGKATNTAWIRTLCPKCTKKYEKKYANPVK